MKNRYVLGIVGLLFTFSACQEKKEVVDMGSSIGKLHISKSHPKPGDTLHIRYAMDTTKSEMPEASYNYLVHYMLYPADIELSEVDGAWEGDLIVPDSATALAFNFRYDKTVDDNDKKGYLQALYTDNDSLLASTQASIGYYYLTWGERNGLKKDKKKALALMESDLLKNPGLGSKWDRHYPRLLLESNPSEAEKLIAEKIKEYSQKEKLSQEDYGILVSLYANMGDKTKEDSITDVAVQKFPKGRVAENQMLSKFFKEKDLNRRIALLNDFESNFGTKAREYNFMLNTVAREFAKKEDWEGFSKYADRITAKNEKAFLYNNTAWQLVEQNNSLDFAESFSKESLDLVKALQAGADEKPNYYSEKQYEKSLKGNYNMFLDTYAFILFKQGKVKDALKYQLEALGDDKVGGRPDMNERYVQFLLANKKPEEAQKEASRFIKINKATPKLKRYLKEAYVANKGSKDGLDDYMADLEKAANQEALAEIKSKMINEKGHDFTLKNLKGEDIALADLKGKVVILDFWATWCGPCKDSFPGMQMAVNKYKDDPNVVFLFIDTLESGNFEQRQKMVSDFILQHKYTFNVLFDNPVKEGSRIYVTTAEYGIKGIPTKVILGPEGNIRFKSVGYMGDNDQLVKELDIMIELASTGTDYDFEQKT